MDGDLRFDSIYAYPLTPPNIFSNSKWREIERMGSAIATRGSLQRQQNRSGLLYYSFPRQTSPGFSNYRPVNAERFCQWWPSGPVTKNNKKQWGSDFTSLIFFGGTEVLPRDKSRVKYKLEVYYPLFDDLSPKIYEENMWSIEYPINQNDGIKGREREISEWNILSRPLGHKPLSRLNFK